MNFNLSSLRDVGQDVIETTADAALGVVYDPEHPYDTMSMIRLLVHLLVITSGVKVVPAKFKHSCL